MKSLTEFRRRLGGWYSRAGRRLPWRLTRDPYRIWISEIMLQQTRVSTVIPYFERFVERFPDVHALACASEERLLECWSGLGYYQRARNLQKAAVEIEQCGGFPSDYESILQLPGIGSYTAAAIASIAFGLPHAALDGNVLRILSRLTNDSGDIGSTTTKKRLEQTAIQLLDREHAGDHNQAMMELGATICLPREPRCPVCPVAGFCVARSEQTQRELPVKLRRTNTKLVERTLLLVAGRDHILLWRRDGKRMGGFWELPELEHLPQAAVGRTIGTFRHSITNHRYIITVVAAKVRRAPPGFRRTRLQELATLPLSTTARKALACWRQEKGSTSGAKGE